MRTLALSTALVVAASTAGWAQTMPDMPGMDHGAHSQTHQPPPPPPSEPSAATPHSHAPEPVEPAQDSDMSGMDHGAMDHSGHVTVEEDAGEDRVGDEPAPTQPSDHAADQLFDPATMQAARAQLRREHGGSLTSKVMLNLGEYQARDGEDGYRWEAEARFGGDIHRLVLKSEGEGGAESGVDAGELQVLYSRAVTPYFDLQAGIRQDFEPTPQQSYATIGFEGVAPYWFDVQGALFVSDRGDVHARLEGAYDLRLTQRLIVQPRAEMNLAARDVPELDVGAGVANIEFGLRLRYEIRRNFAPYIGVSYDEKFGDSADFARAAGENPSRASFVVGLRGWF